MAPPPRAKLHKGGTGKSIIKPSTSSLSDSITNVVALSPELQQQFEVELCWCIQQLQIALNSGKLKQIQDHTRALNSLMGNSAPIVKKRQIMRNSFGDYRSKMALEDKKLSKVIQNVKVKPGVPNKKSMFLKKSLFQSSGSDGFKFNFETPALENDVRDHLESVTLESKESTKSDFHFIPAGNDFKFNFTIDQNAL